MVSECGAEKRSDSLPYALPPGLKSTSCPDLLTSRGERGDPGQPDHAALPPPPCLIPGFPRRPPPPLLPSLQVKNEETLVSQTMRRISKQHVVMLTGKKGERGAGVWGQRQAGHVPRNRMWACVTGQGSLVPAGLLCFRLPAWASHCTCGDLCCMGHNKYNDRPLLALLHPLCRCPQAPLTPLSLSVLPAGTPVQNNLVRCWGEKGVFRGAEEGGRGSASYLFCFSFT